jgi:hypothetical protein
MGGVERGGGRGRGRGENTTQLKNKHTGAHAHTPHNRTKHIPPPPLSLSPHPCTHQPSRIGSNEVVGVRTIVATAASAAPIFGGE